jgi:hypothetical protein
MPYKVVIDYIGPPDASFSEVYYSPAASAALALQFNAGLLTARTNMLDSTCIQVRARASNVLQSRDTAVAVFNQRGRYNSTGGPLMSGATAVLKLTGAAGGTRKLLMRGLPDDLFQIDSSTGRDKPPPALLNALTVFSAALKDQGWGILRITPVPAVGIISIYMRQRILAIDGTAGNGQSLLTVQDALGWAKGNQLIIGAASKKNLPSLNGRYTVLDTPVIAGGNTSFHILYQTPEKQLISYPEGYVRKLDYLPVSTFDGNPVIFDHYGTRSTRVPLSHSRGAKRAARIRRLV